MRHIPFEELTHDHVRMLVRSLKTAPLYEQTSIEDMLKGLKDRSSILFEIPQGIIVAEVRVGGGEKRLSIPALYCLNFGAHCRGVIADVKRLAREWGCVRIETCCYDNSLAKIIKLLGGTAESVNMVMEAGHGKQEDNDEHHELDEHRRTS